jgi:hypothetical protein
LLLTLGAFAIEFVLNYALSWIHLVAMGCMHGQTLPVNTAESDLSAQAMPGPLDHSRIVLHVHGVFVGLVAVDQDVSTVSHQHRG